jgi:hypothetical protein
MKLFYKTLLFTSIIVISSCSPENYINIGQIQNIKVNGFEENALRCQAELEIENKYFLPFKIYSNGLKVYAYDQVIGRIEIKDPIHVKAKQKKVYTIVFKFEPIDEYSGIFSIIQKLTNANGNFSIKGSIKARSLLIKRNIPVEMNLNDI